MNPEPIFGVLRKYVVPYDTREEAEWNCLWWAGNVLMVSFDGGETWQEAV